jgi:hypothetical protein
MELYNGTIGTVEEIVFDHGKNPNHGDHLRCTAVKMPLYCGPVWDRNNPKVRLSICGPHRDSDKLLMLLFYTVHIAYAAHPYSFSCVSRQSSKSML